MKKLIVSFLVFNILINYSLPALSFNPHFIANPKIIDIIQTENVVSKDNINCKVASGRDE